MSREVLKHVSLEVVLGDPLGEEDLADGADALQALFGYGAVAGFAGARAGQLLSEVDPEALVRRPGPAQCRPRLAVPRGLPPGPVVWRRTR